MATCCVGSSTGEVVAVPGLVAPVKIAMAQQAYWDLPMATLQESASEFHSPSLAARCFSVVFELVQFTLHTPDAEALDICRLRLVIAHDEEARQQPLWS